MLPKVCLVERKVPKAENCVLIIMIKDFDLYFIKREMHDLWPYSLRFH